VHLLSGAILCSFRDIEKLGLVPLLFQVLEVLFFLLTEHSSIDVQFLNMIFVMGEPM